ncbi:zinc finger and BTB domain-containing protein 49 [Amia ocellicauda]|uniref:zinc finger and BTB domain-containing protein 49 n=1 Tax=Amia ocellicauda TaxID=2972642 RepID=UPI003463A37A
MESLSSHSSYLLQQLHEQRIQGLLCDCMLVVKGVCFKAHKNVLAAFSSYFRSLFQNSPGQKNDVFHLDITDVGGIGQILDFMYTSHLDLNQDNVQALLDVAQCLQVPNVLNMCNHFLKPYTPAVEAPGSLPGSASFSLPAVLTIETECMLGATLPSEMGLHCPSEAQKPACAPSDIDLSRRPQALLQTQTFDALSSAPAAPDKLSTHTYKLRNFYSKQYFKQNPALNGSLNPPLNTVAEEHFSSSVTDSNTPVDIPVGAVNTASESQGPVSTFMMPPATEDSECQSSGGKSSPVSRQVRTKKAVYLKKYNYLRSQKALEESTLQPAKTDNKTPVDANEAEVIDQHVGDLPGVSLMEEEVGEPANVSCSQLGSSSPAHLEEPEHNLVANSTDAALLQNYQKQYCCEMCGKTFKHPSNLELHKRSHTGEKPFQCNICGKNFSQAGNLQTHLRRHSGEKPYICEICGKSFAASGDVQRHIVIHTGEKPHLCDICGRGFSNFSNLKEHKKTHTTDKVFTCNQCGKSFNMQRKLLKHRIRHTGERPYSCQTCGKSFAGSGDLRRHVRTHTGERPYTCETCGKCFTRSAVLRRHRTVHCKSAQDSPAAEELASAVDSPFLQTVCHKSQDSDSFATLMSDKLPPAPSETPPGVDFAPGSSASFSELRSMVPHHLIAQQDKLCPDPIKLPKPPDSFAYTEENSANSEETLQPSSTSMIRPSLTALDNHCSLPVGNHRLSSASFRSNEAPFFSSVTLWGLAMKTLQNDNELEQ